MGGFVGKILDKGAKVVTAVTNVFGGNFNPYVALGVFAIGWYFQELLNQKYLILEQTILKKLREVY